MELNSPLLIPFYELYTNDNTEFTASTSASASAEASVAAAAVKIPPRAEEEQRAAGGIRHSHVLSGRGRLLTCAHPIQLPL